MENVEKLWVSVKTFCLLLVTLIGIIYILAPDAVGRWEAMRDVAYDQIWYEYVSDQDIHYECVDPCVDPLVPSPGDL